MIGDKAIQQVENILASVENGMVDVGEYIANTIRNRTRSQTSASGGPFAPYSKRYARRKGVDQAAVDLTDTREMLDSIMPRNSNGTRYDARGRGSQFRGQPTNRGQFVAARDVEIEVGPTGFRNIGLAEIHHFGRGRNPMRQFMSLTDQEADEAVQVFGRSLFQPDSTTETMTIKVNLG